MAGPVFVDSNVLVYWLDASEPEKQRHAQTWLQYLWPNRSGRGPCSRGIRCSPTAGPSTERGRCRIATACHGGTL